MAVAEYAGKRRRTHAAFVLDGESPLHGDGVSGELLLGNEGLLQELVGPPRHVVPQLHQPPLELLHLLHVEALDVGVPVERLRPLHLLHGLLEGVALLLLGLDQVVQLHALVVELADGRLAAGLGRRGRGCDGRLRVRVAGEEAVDDGVDGGVAEGEDLAGGGEHDDPQLRATEDGDAWLEIQHNSQGTFRLVRAKLSWESIRSIIFFPDFAGG
ncbi:hypothetical protein C4D60_Mb08t04350 [Musa balbisiana]|uniref:Uncharacterized protein n=1 Tax=Musa balbisiana TaxID=52838 RepID=A0A4S8K1B9_MUSBA|nr:hypothetical protein C4D60_Mb08t04350 [Musa balbisiana]